MKKIFISLSLILLASYCFGQAVDTAALGILQKSFDKIAALENISYRLTTIDTMIRHDNPLSIRSKRVTSKSVQGIIKKNAYWYLRHDDNAEWLIRNDTLYKNQQLPRAQVTFSTNWKNDHSLDANSIYNILGMERPAPSASNTSIQFVKNAVWKNYYVIDIVSKIDYESEETKSILYFNRYWVNKENLYCQRRMMYSKKLYNGKEAVDIYDFSVSQIKTGNLAFDPSHFFKVQPLMEKSDDIEDRKIEGNLAPGFSVTNVRTGENFTLEQLKGKIVVIDFWCLSCPPCRDLMPKIQQLSQAFLEKDLIFIGIKSGTLPEINC